VDGRKTKKNAGIRGGRRKAASTNKLQGEYLGRVQRTDFKETPT